MTTVPYVRSVGVEECIHEQQFDLAFGETDVLTGWRLHILTRVDHEYFVFLRIGLEEASCFQDSRHGC